MRSTYWPLFDLRIVTPRVELRPPSDEDLAELAALAADGVHDPDFMPFAIPWTEGGPEAAARSTLQFNWRIRAEWKPEAWHLSLVTVVDGEVVGMQGISAQRASRSRRPSRPARGSACATRARASARRCAPRCCTSRSRASGAEVAQSGAWEDNKPSLGVSAAMGYEPNGEHIGVRQGRGDRLVHLRLPRTTWEARRRDDIRIEGLDGAVP